MSEPVVRVCGVGEVAADVALLTDVEDARRQRLVQQADRDAYLAAHVLVRLVTAELTGSDPGRLTLAHTCPTCAGTDHGRPAIVEHPEVRVSLSHARGVVAAIAASTPCGIDVEAIGRIPDPALTPAERTWAGEDATRRTLLWTRKEAWVKASGVALDRAAETDVLHAPWVSGEIVTAGYAATWVVL